MADSLSLASKKKPRRHDFERKRRRWLLDAQRRIHQWRKRAHFVSKQQELFA